MDPIRGEKAMSKYTPKPIYDPEPQQPSTLLNTYRVAGGDRVPPVHKPARRGQCEWVTGIGWVYNPSRRRFVW